MRNRKQNGIEIEAQERGMAMPVSISKQPSTRRSVQDGLSSSTQAAEVSQSPQARNFLFSFPPSRRALKHPGWRIIAAEAKGSTLVQRTRVDQSGTLRRSRSENSSLRAGKRPFNDIEYLSNLPLSHTVKADSGSKV